jgi:DNA helicase-2/ATP-dependent DNA helicase PcrA
MLLAERTIESQSRQENLNEFVTVIEELMEQNPELRLEEFLDQVSLASDLDKAEMGDEYVTLMTMHLSKGLEFDVVFLTGLEEGLFPHARSLNSETEVEEERRLCYVGMTRAKQRLFLSCAQTRHLFGVPQFNAPSRFLEDVPEELVQQVELKAPPGSVKAAPAFSRPLAPRPSSVAAPHSYIDRTYTQEDISLYRGQRVSHALFGLGQLQAWEGSGDALKVTVRFQSGVTKKLVFKYANLSLGA